MNPGAEKYEVAWKSWLVLPWLASLAGRVCMYEDMPLGQIEPDSLLDFKYGQTD